LGSGGGKERPCSVKRRGVALRRGAKGRERKKEEGIAKSLVIFFVR
jgi:hypothetical protein